jgi:hypothetical protein
VNKFRKPLILLTCMAMVGGLISCSGDTPGRPPDSSLTLRTYTVPQGDAEALSTALNHVLGLDNYQHDIGRTYWSGPGQVLVLAPARLQDSIASSIKEMVGQNNAATSARPLRLNAWIVDVYQGTGVLDPNLKAIQPALQAFEEDSGPAHFTQKHYFTAVSDAGADTTMSPLPYYDLEYSITENGDRLMLKFDYRHHFVGLPVEMLSGQVTTRLGQTLVLGLLAGPSAGGPGNPNLSRAADDAPQAGLRYKLLVMRIVPAT